MLTLTSVSKSYPGGVHALREVNLEVPPGVFGLLGPNGAGKSTLMRTIATLQRPDAGSIVFGTIDALAHPEALRRVLGYLPQDFGTYPHTSAEAMLHHFAVLKGLRGSRQWDEVERTLRLTHLWDVRARHVDTFSGGMKQRFGIAQALLGSPALLIVDEPTAGLDPAERRRFQNLLVDIGREVVVILSTHIVDDVAALCPRLAIMGQGRILRTGAPASMCETLAGRLWQRVVRPHELTQLRSVLPVVSTRLDAGRLVVRVVADEPPPGTEPVAPTLEDVYFSTLIAHGLAPHED